MSILDVAAKILSTYQADTSDMKAKVKELIGLQKEHAAAELAAAEARNKQADGWVDKLGKIGLAFNVVERVATAAFDGLKEYGHRLDLEATAAGVSLDRLSKAAGSLKTEMELLEHAAVFNKSAFQLTQEQMETAERAMWALEERGKSSTEVWDAVSTALTKGTTRALEGLIGPINKAGGGFDVNGDVLLRFGDRAKAVDAIMRALARTSAEVGEGQYDAADKVQVTAVRIADSMEHIKEAMGKMVIALEPLIKGVAALGEAAGSLVNKIAEGWQDIGDVLSYARGRDRDEILKEIGERHHIDLSEAAKGQYENYLAAGGSDIDWVTTSLNRSFDAQMNQQLGIGDQANAPWSFNPVGAFANLWYRGTQAGQMGIAMGENALERTRKRLEQQKELARQIAEEQRRMVDELAQQLTDDLVQELEGEGRLFTPGQHSTYGPRRTWEGPATTATAGGRFGEFLDASLARQSYALDYAGGPELRQLVQRPDYLALAGPTEGVLGGIYGDYFQTGSARSPYGQQQAQAYQQFQGRQGASFLEQTFGKIEDFNLYKTAFDALSGATSAALAAWIDGSESAGTAFKKFIGEALKGLASQMLIESLKHAAYALGSLAFGDARGAGQHAAAAAAFGAGAAAAAVAAKELGGGAASSRGAAPAAPNVSGGGATAGATTQAIIVVGDSFAEDTPRMRQLKAQRLVGLAVGNNAIVYG